MRSIAGGHHAAARVPDRRQPGRLVAQPHHRRRRGRSRRCWRPSSPSSGRARRASRRQGAGMAADGYASCPTQILSAREARVAGMGGRMSTVIKAKINKLLDKAEDPGETLDYSYQKQMELLQNVKKGIADVVTSKKRLQMQQQKLEQQVVKLDTQARQALAAGPRGPRPHRARAQEVRADRAAVARPAGRRAREPAGAADRQGAEAAHEDRAVPHQEGGHQGAVLRRRGPGADLRGRDRRRRGDGRRRARDAARAWTRPRRCAPARARWRSSRRPARSTTTCSSAPARTTSTASCTS